MTAYQRAKRHATWVSAAIAITLYSLILIIPAIAGQVTADQSVTYQR